MINHSLAASSGVQFLIATSFFCCPMLSYRMAAVSHLCLMQIRIFCMPTPMSMNCVHAALCTGTFCSSCPQVLNVESSWCHHKQGMLHLLKACGTEKEDEYSGVLGCDAVLLDEWFLIF